MFINLPEEIERIIWKFYFSKHVVKEVTESESVWCSPSDKLISVCKDKGCAQIAHTDLERVLFMNQTPHTDIVHKECLENKCGNCIYHGFPCANASFYGGFDDRLTQIWNTEFYLDSEDL